MTDEAGTGSETATSRRSFLASLGSLGLVASLVAAYGTFAGFLGRFLYPARAEQRQWLFVREIDGVEVGGSWTFRTPDAVPVNISRRENRGTPDDFIALSSTCPHLGCQVHWEPQNQRYFCPCHNGVFDPDGVGTEGPPAEAGQSLPRYPLKVEGGLLFIGIPEQRLAEAGSAETPPAHRTARGEPCRGDCPGCEGSKKSRRDVIRIGRA